MLNWAATFTIFEQRFTLVANLTTKNSTSYLEQVIIDTLNPPLAVYHFCQEKSVVNPTKMFHHFIVETNTSDKKNGSLKVISCDILSDGKKYVLRGAISFKPPASKSPNAVGIIIYHLYSGNTKMHGRRWMVQIQPRKVFGIQSHHTIVNCSYIPYTLNIDLHGSFSK